MQYKIMSFVCSQHFTVNAEIPTFTSPVKSDLSSSCNENVTDSDITASQSFSRVLITKTMEQLLHC